MKALILAAGFGKRLGELTQETPKPMLPIGGQPMLAYAIRHLAHCGFRQIALNLHFQAGLIRSSLGDGTQFGVELTYSYEPELLGTAGALLPLKNFFKNEPDFLVLYGDIVTNQDITPLLRFHRQNKAAATLLLHKRKNSNSIIEMDSTGRIQVFLERPPQNLLDAHPEAWVNSGIQVLTPEVYQYLPHQTPSDLPRDLYANQIAHLPIYGYPLSGYRCAVDSPERYTRVCEDLQNGTLRYPWQ